MKKNIEIIQNSQKRSRKLWMKTRSKDWWNNIFASDNYSEIFENFRMDKETFNFICEKLDEKLKPHPLHVRESLSTKCKVAISIYKLASSAEYRVVGNQFGVHKSTVKKCLYEFCDAMLTYIKEEIYMPKNEEAEEVIKNFKEKSGIPQVLGAIDGTHIPITPKQEGYRDYINRKGWPSLILQAVVDSKYLFRDITCKHPGCTHDATVLKDSFLYSKYGNLDLPVEILTTTL
ncbi:putative nuclease HARBI1 [Condylostylus longicornis]|uniref:putative nuclease HARBI1 n=1 Tax=Condylostylus longicornis TaxID=2530218 RepID=UPI00244DC36F|nr:putative nuclease HARBI1 [Condylostylus longicornis]